MNEYAMQSLITQRFNELICKEDKKRLEIEIELNIGAIESLNNKELFRTQIVACLFVEKYNIALNSLNKISKEYKNSNELAAMINYTIKQYSDAYKILDNIKEYKYRDSSTLIKSLCDWECGNKYIYTHESNLEKILPTSMNANSFLGNIFYNRKKYIDAAMYYGQSAILAKNTEFSRLNALRAIYHYDKKAAENGFSKFYYDTNSKLTPKELLAEMNKEKVPVTRICINRFHQIARELLQP